MKTFDCVSVEFKVCSDPKAINQTNNSSLFRVCVFFSTLLFCWIHPVISLLSDQLSSINSLWFSNHSNRNCYVEFGNFHLFFIVCVWFGLYFLICGLFTKTKNRNSKKTCTTGFVRTFFCTECVGIAFNYCRHHRRIQCKRNSYPGLCKRTIFLLTKKWRNHQE